MIWVGVWSLLPPPIWNSENEHGWQVVHCASAAAIFIGWYWPSITPSSSPTSMANRIAGTRTTSASRADRVNTPRSPPCRSCHAEIASMTEAPVTSETSSTLAYPHVNTGLVNTAQMSFSTGLPLTITYPTGCCIHELAAMMNAADSALPNETAQIVSRCTRRDSLSQPNSHNPRKVDSRKNAASPSIASGAPKMLPTSREYAPQFIPNSNSCTIPVTTPIATLMTSSVPKNLVNRRYSSWRLRCHAVCSSAVRKASPIVIGMKKKWLIDVNANCHRARSSLTRAPSGRRKRPIVVLQRYCTRAADGTHRPHGVISALAFSEDSDRVDWGARPGGQSQRRQDAQERPAAQLPAERQEVFEVQVVEQVQAHRVDREHVHGEVDALDRARRGVAVAVA